MSYFRFLISDTHSDVVCTLQKVSRKPENLLFNMWQNTVKVTGPLLRMLSGLVIPVLFVIVGIRPLQGQIRGNGVTVMVPAQYPSGFGRTDTIYIFCSPDENGEAVKGSLTAFPPGGVAGWNFSWQQYNASGGTYDLPFRTDNGVASSQVDSLESGGYRVHITDAASLDTFLYAWVYIDTPYVKASLQNFTCDYVALHGEALTAPYVYYDPADQQPLTLTNGISFQWSSVPDSDIPFPTLEINPITYSPPYEDTWYKLEITDSFSCTNYDEFFYETIHVKADFEPDPNQGEAPLEVSFVNKSVNAVSFEWNFGDDTTSILETPEPHTYYIPGDYRPVLIARSEEGCTDSIAYEFITVDPSEVAIPNAFSPNEDGYNDYFRIYSKSLRFVYMQVFSRSGQKVYEFSGRGTALQEWQGWDGRVNGNGKAAPGLYFYIIRAVGWDDVVYEGKEYRGFVYLFRE